jgi:mutator protein MutT
MKSIPKNPSNFHMVLPFVLGIITDQQGKILIGKHPNLSRKPYPCYWDLPGGKVEEGETAEEAIRREIKEELNFEILDCTLFAVFHHSGLSILPECTSKIPSLGICYVLEVSGELKATEQDDVHFADLSEVEDYYDKMVPWTKYFIKKYLKN